MQHYKNYWRGFSDFDGQSSRKDFWIPILINFVISIALLIIMIGSFMAWFIPFSGGVWLTGVSLAVLFIWCVIRIVPNAAVLVRRFHDVGLVGWLAVVLFICHFIPYIDIVADILIIIIACMNPNSANVQAFAWKKPTTEQQSNVTKGRDDNSNSQVKDITKDDITKESNKTQADPDEIKQKHYEQLSLNLDDTAKSNNHDANSADTNDSKSDNSKN